MLLHALHATHTMYTMHAEHVNLRARGCVRIGPVSAALLVLVVEMRERTVPNEMAECLLGLLDEKAVVGDDLVDVLLEERIIRRGRLRRRDGGALAEHLVDLIRLKPAQESSFLGVDHRDDLARYSGLVASHPGGLVLVVGLAHQLPEGDVALVVVASSPPAHEHVVDAELVHVLLAGGGDRVCLRWLRVQSRMGLHMRMR
mmetsp:Transcript_27101/g.76265  ORF Transcript_27101/g.76265 Transcript_27101/m.76265 type:complete len:201 (-) Transcript_27101:772-1374(-)